MEIKRIQNIKSEIPTFANYEQKFFKMEESYQHLWEKYWEEDRGLALYYLEENNNVIGLLGSTIEEVEEDSEGRKKGEKYSFLMAIVVEEKHQGKGFGKELMEFYIDEGKTSGVDFLFLRVDPKNSKAIGLYKKYGFKERTKNEQSLYMQKRF